MAGIRSSAANGSHVIAVAAVLPALVLRTGSTSRFGGAILLVGYAVLAVAFYLAGDR